MWAQPLSVYSDLAEIERVGQGHRAGDAARNFSPALVRNGFTSFQVVVQAPADAHWWLFVGQNPENAVKLTMYRESGDMLEPVDLPRHERGHARCCGWMCGPRRSARAADQDRAGVATVNEDWVTYPIEARVMEARVPDGGAAHAAFAP